VARYTPPVVSRPPGSDVIEDWELFYGLAIRLGVQLSLEPVAPYRSSPPGQAVRQPIDMNRQPTTDELIEIMTANSRVPLAVVKATRTGDPSLPILPSAVGNPFMIADLNTTLAADDDEATDIRPRIPPSGPAHAPNQLVTAHTGGRSWTSVESKEQKLPFNRLGVDGSDEPLRQASAGVGARASSGGNEA
jgi:hypothetical protein